MSSKIQIKTILATVALTFSGLNTTAHADNTREFLGTIGGAVVGGLLGDQIGKGRGNTLATIAGAVIGGFVGNEIGRQMDENARRRMYHSYNNTVVDANHGERRHWNSGRWRGDYEVVEVGYRPQTQVRCKTIRHTVYEDGYQVSRRTRTSCYERTRWVPYEKSIRLVNNNSHRHVNTDLDYYDRNYRSHRNRQPIVQTKIAPANVHCIRKGLNHVEIQQNQASRGNSLNHRLFGSVDIILNEVLFRCNKGRKSRALAKTNALKRRGFTCSRSFRKKSVMRGQKNISQRLTRRAIRLAGGINNVISRGEDIAYQSGSRNPRAKGQVYKGYFQNAAYDLVFTCTKY